MYGDTLSSACILMFWLTQDETGWGGGPFPPANDSAQVTLKAPEKVPNVDVAQRKGNIVLVSKQKKLVPE